MSWLSKIAPMFFLASNENTLALSHIKFDFSLVKVEAPKDFGPVGLAISQCRKTEAEDGKQHRTARKPGALFEQLTPSTPKLVEAYGRRVSEIINSPGVNPQGRDEHGPFQSFIGANATVMWAAAMSGTSSIAVYLLACLIAYAWNEKEATSIWVKIVTERKKEISECYLSNGIVPESSLYNARQDISREELASWDSSARSWLQSAD